MSKKIEIKTLSTISGIAAGANVIVYALGKVLGANFVVNGGVTMEIPWFLPAFATFVPLLIAGISVRQISKKFTGFQVFASWAGLTFAFLSIGTVLVASQQVETIIALGIMHAIAGIAWFLSTKK